jgi:DNA-binding CsgD family transcriptional regulator
VAQAVLADYRKMMDLVESLYYQEGQDAIARTLFEASDALIPHSCGIFFPIDPHTYEYRPGFYQNIDPTLMQAYLEHYAPMDPFVRVAPFPDRLNTVARFSELAARCEVDACEFVDFMNKVPYRYALGTLSGVNGLPVAAFGLGRMRGDSDFSGRDQNILQRIAPHIAQAAYLQQVLKAHKESAEVGVLVLGSQREILFETPAALRLLGPALRKESSELADKPLAHIARGPEGLIHLRRLPLTPSSLFSRFGSNDVDNNAEGRPPSRNLGRANGSIQGRPLILVVEPFLQRQGLLRRLEFFGLSPREVEVALGVLRGQSNRTIAQVLSIKETTVKVHLRHIFDKLQISSRCGLIARVVGLEEGEGPDSSMFASSRPIPGLEPV